MAVRTWLGLIVAAEAIAFGLGGLVATATAATSLAFAVVAAVEIPLLCTAQWVVLRTRVRSLRWWRWTVATGVVAAVTWGGAIAATSSADVGTGPEPPLALQVAGYMALGAAAGALMGGAQWLVLRPVAEPGAWIAWSAAAWAAGMPLSSLITGSLPSGATVISGLLYGLAGGAAMGAAVALVLWPAVVRLRPISGALRPRGRRRSSQRRSGAT